MFKRNKTPSISSVPDRESVTASLHPSWDSGRSPRSPTAAQRRQPDSGVGLARLLETYDDYPHIVQQLEVAQEQLRIAEGQAHEAELQRFDKEAELQKEKEDRGADAVRATKDLEAAEKVRVAEGAQGKKDLAEAERVREKKIRDDLEPKIKTLEGKNATLTTERDKLTKELADLRLQSKRWIDGIESLHKERLLIEERENKAAEERKTVDEKRKVLETTILNGLREASVVPETKAAADGTATATTETTTAATKPSTAASGSTPFGSTAKTAEKAE